MNFSTTPAEHLELRTDTDLTDITLACEDGQQVEAHKVILGASRAFFKNLLKYNKLVVYMKGVRSEDLMAFLDFLYTGETSVYQENLDAFLGIADNLSFEGLTRNEQADNTTSQIKQIISELHTQETKPNFSVDESIIEHGIKIQPKVAPDYKGYQVNFTDVQVLDKNVKSLMTKSKNVISYGSQGNKRADICSVCGKEGRGVI